MAASYPSSVFTFATVNNGDTSDASQIDNPVAEIIAVETGLLNGVQHNLIPLADGGEDLGTNAKRWNNIWCKGTVQLNGQTYTFPSGAGAARSVLQNNGSNTLSWAPFVSVVASTAVGTQNDWAPGLVGNTIIRLNPGSALTITGLAGGYDGQLVTLYNVSANLVTFTSLDAGSTAANQLVNIVTSAATPVNTSGFATYVYDGVSARWRLVAYDQGAWIAFTPTLAGSGTLVPSGYTGLGCRYRLSGKTLSISAGANAIAVAGAGTAIRLTLPGGFTAFGRTEPGFARVSDNGGTVVAGLWFIGASQTYIEIYKDLSEGVNWTVSAGTTVFEAGSVVVDVI